MVDVIHSELITEHGGIQGIRQGGEDLIESALARPKHRFSYEPEAALADLAASYLFGLVKNHGFLDGNKRVGFVCAATFLVMNGQAITATEQDAAEFVLNVDAGSVEEVEVATWIRENIESV